MDVLSGGGFLSSKTSATYHPEIISNPPIKTPKQDAHNLMDDPFSYKGRVVIALYSFEAEFIEEMSIKERDTLVIDDSAPDRPGWSYVLNPYTSSEGYVPTNYIQ